MCRLEMSEERHLPDQSLSECTEVIRPRLRCTHHQKLDLRIPIQTPEHKGTGDPALTHTTEPLDDLSRRPVLEVGGYIILYRCGVRQMEVLPYEVQEVPEVSYQWMLTHVYPYWL
jgi:hypothetical protein